MTKKEAIKRLVDFALIDKTTENKFVSLGIVTPTQAALLKAKTGFSLEGYERIVDKSAINHVLKVHGNEKKEALKGQIAVVEKDFENLPEIIKSQNVIFSGKNKQGKNCLLYEAKIGNTYYYVEEIRTGRKHLAMQTLYKRK
jgi:phage-Barnase-EndoU-ColicinE5/D-RelE like nuclease3